MVHQPSRATLQNNLPFKNIKFNHSKCLWFSVICGWIVEIDTIDIWTELFKVIQTVTQWSYWNTLHLCIRNSVFKCQATFSIPSIQWVLCEYKIYLVLALTTSNAYNITPQLHTSAFRPSYFSPWRKVKDNVQPCINL